MNIGEVLRISMEAIGKNKIRSLLTMLGIIIGVAAVIIMIAVSNGTASAIASQITSLGSNLIFISPNFTRNGPETGAQAGTALDACEEAGILPEIWVHIQRVGQDRIHQPRPIGALVAAHRRDGRRVHPADPGRPPDDRRRPGAALRDIEVGDRVPDRARHEDSQRQLLCPD